MKHTVLVSGHPDECVASQKALSYCQSILSNGDEINQVFFMHDANYVAVHSSAQQWSAFAAENNVSLQTCESTAEKRYIQSRYYAAGFLQGGLSTLADSILSSDVVHQFKSDVENLQIESNYSLIENRKVKNRKKIVFIFETAPYADSLAAEGVDLLLVLSAFEADLKVVFAGEGIENINQMNVEISANEMNHIAPAPRYTKRFKALADFGVNEVFVLNSTINDANDTNNKNVIANNKRVDTLAYINAIEISLDEFQTIKQTAHVLRF